jgi:hypothetical protein
MFAKKNFILRSNARTSKSPREFSRADIRDGTREIPFFEGSFWDVVSVVSANESFRDPALLEEGKGCASELGFCGFLADCALPVIEVEEVARGSALSILRVSFNNGFIR